MNQATEAVAANDQEALRLLESALAALGCVSQGVAVFDHSLTLQLCNARFLALLGYPGHLGKPGISLREMLQFNLARGDYGPTAGTEAIEARLEHSRRNKDFTYERRTGIGETLEVNGRRIDGGGFVVTYTDITERKEAERTIAIQANYDALTGLINRALFEEFLKHQVQRDQRTGTNSFALLFINLDGFKNINDVEGRSRGDLLLQAVGKRLKDAVRDSDVVARLGGDEFGVLLTDLYSAQNAEAVALKIMDTIGQPYHVEGKEVRMTASAGVAYCPAEVLTGEDMLKRADAAMYHAKSAGRHRFQFAPTSGDV